MDEEQEIEALKKRLKELEENIRVELGKIEGIKAKLVSGYRRRDREKYEVERGRITANLQQYKTEMGAVKKRLSELEEGVPS